MAEKNELEGFIQELEEARKVQMGMLPQMVPEAPGFQIAAHCAPAVAVGGDFYDFIPIAGGKLGVVIGDAVGHGIASALLMSMTLTNFRFLAHDGAPVATVLNGVNQSLTQGMPARTAVTSIYTMLDGGSNHLNCAMAGMQPLHIKSKSRDCVAVVPTGVRFPLGISQKIEYQDCSVKMDSSDTLVLYTDGIPEARNLKGDFYSFCIFRPKAATQSG